MKPYAQEFVAHVLAPQDGGFAPVAWSPAPVTVRAVDDRDTIRGDYEADVELQEAETVLSPLTDGARVGWLLAFGAAPTADAADIEALAAGRELRIVVRRRIDPGAGKLTLTTRLLR